MNDDLFIWLWVVVVPVTLLYVIGICTKRRSNILPAPRMDRIIRTHRDAWDVGAGRVRV